MVAAEEKRIQERKKQIDAENQKAAESQKADA